ncbi:MAG: SPOR domain-containing protein [Hyphomicrobiaceae bacterium]|nr:SPOR domain-containing protein [Hyphomicrobiaceae bacterium]
MFRSLCVAILCGLLWTMAAPTQSADAAGKSVPPAGLAMLRQGHAQLKARKYAAAIATFSSALTSGKLSKEETGKALYYRGVAYRKSGQPALAIADFSNALWLRAGLSATQRQDAEKQRQAAYAEAGAAKSAPAPSPSGGWQTAAPTRSPKPPTASAPAAPKKSATANFFSNLFGGGTKSNPPPGPPPSRAAPPRTTSSVPHTSGWTSTASVNPAPRPPSRPPVTAARTRPPARSKRQASNRARGRIVVQVAALRGRAEADALARRLAARHAALLNGRTPRVVPRAVGNMGTLYQVRIGPFTTAAATRPLCRKVRASGLDCLVQSN